MPRSRSSSSKRSSKRCSSRKSSRCRKYCSCYKCKFPCGKPKCICRGRVICCKDGPYYNCEYKRGFCCNKCHTGGVIVNYNLSRFD